MAKKKSSGKKGKSSGVPKAGRVLSPTASIGTVGKAPAGNGPVAPQPR